MGCVMAIVINTFVSRFVNEQIVLRASFKAVDVRSCVATPCMMSTDDTQLLIDSETLLRLKELGDLHPLLER